MSLVQENIPSLGDKLELSKEGKQAYISEVTSERETRSLPKHAGDVMVNHVVCGLSVN